jgi:fumarate reductase flavoprotein subunit
VNKDGYRYLQDYGLGPAEPSPRNKAMELGPRDRLSQAFWYEQQKGRTIEGPHGSVVHLDLRHLGEAKLRERLPQIYELAEQFLGVDPARAPIPVRPAVHYTMGGILVDGLCASPLPGLYAAGECSSVGIHGANRLGSNSLSELLRVWQGGGRRSRSLCADRWCLAIQPGCRSRHRPSSSGFLD